MRILDIFIDKLNLNAGESTAFDVWLGELKRDALTIAKNTTSTGGGAGVDAGNVVISLEDGVTLFNPDTGARTIYLDPDGDASFGDDIDNPGDTALKVFSNAQTYNSEAIGEGDLLLGDNSASKANIQWDKSTGRLNFRTGTTTKGYIDTDGSIVVAYGKIGGWNIGATTIQDDTPIIVLDSANKKITVGTNKVVLDTTGITAVAGFIGGWNINATDIRDNANQIILDHANRQIHVGAGITLDGPNQRVDVGASAPKIVIDGANKNIHSSNYSSGAAGFQLEAVSGDAEFNNIVARGTFRASVFEIGTMSAVGGHVVVSKNAAEVWEDVTTPGSGNFQLKLKDSVADAPVAAVNDVITIKDWNGSEIVEVWVTVLAISDQSGYTTYTVDLESGASKDLQKGMAAVNYGPSGAGVLHLEAGAQTTRLRIATHAGAPWTTMTNMVVLGNMRNTYGTGANDRYGIGIGDYSAGNYLSYNAEGAGQFILKAGDGNVIIDGDAGTLTTNHNVILGGTSGLEFRGSTGNIRYITWKYFDDPDYRLIGDQAGDYGGSGDAIHWVRSWKQSGDPWDESGVILVANNTITGEDVRVWLNSSGLITLSGADVSVPDGDLYTVAWTDYSSTSSIVGWSSKTAYIEYKKIGKFVYVKFRITGTSNSTSCSFTLPYAENSVTSVYGTCLAENNGVRAIGWFAMGASTVNFIPTATTGTGSWVASGSKEIFGQFFYEAA